MQTYHWKYDFLHFSDRSDLDMSVICELLSINIQGVSKKTGIMEFCLFCVIKGLYNKNHGFTSFMITSAQMAIIQDFTAPWEIKFEEMVVILNFPQKMNNNDNIHHVCIKSIIKSW